MPEFDDYDSRTDTWRESKALDILRVLCFDTLLGVVLILILDIFI
jgi:hypothetical protein